MKRPLIGTSWKMNLAPSKTVEYCAALRPLVEAIDDRTLFVLPSYPSLSAAGRVLAGSNVAWGAQDVHPAEEGPHTGDVSASMLADLGCTFVEVGHHERRRDHHEDDDLIAAKVSAIQRWGMTAILCVGEVSRTTPEAAEEHVLGQLRFVNRFDPAKLIVAYEPAWAIGAGSERAPAAWIGTIHGAIHRRLSDLAAGGDEVPVIYGGSVDAAGAGAVLACPGVDGLFVGRYALTPQGFAEIAGTPIRPNA